MSLDDIKSVDQPSKDLITGYLKEIKKCDVPQVVNSWCLLFYHRSKFKFNHIVYDPSKYDDDYDSQYESDGDVIERESDYFNIRDAKKGILPQLISKADEFRDRIQKVPNYQAKSPLKLFQLTMKEYYEEDKGINFYDRNYGYRLSMTRYIFIAWICILSIKPSVYKYELPEILSEIESNLSGDASLDDDYLMWGSDGEFDPNRVQSIRALDDGLEVVVHIHALLCAQYDFDDTYNEFWEVDIHDDRYESVYDYY